MTAHETRVQDHFRTHIEKIMLQLPPELPETHSAYLAGYIDCLFESGLVSEETRGILYSEYSS